MKEKVTVRKEDRKEYRKNKRRGKFFYGVSWMLEKTKVVVGERKFLVGWIEKTKEKWRQYTIAAAFDTVEGRHELAKAMLEPLKKSLEKSRECDRMLSIQEAKDNHPYFIELKKNAVV
jgi:hypothetical protein